MHKHSNSNSEYSSGSVTYTTSVLGIKNTNLTDAQLASNLYLSMNIAKQMQQ